MRGDYMLSAVTRALTEHFKGEMSVVTEVPAQGAASEYLFVHQINREQKPDNGSFYNRFYFFDIRYHPDSKIGSQYRRMTELEEALTECLHLIPTDDQPVKASSMKSERPEGVLHFFVDYPVRVIQTPTTMPVMETVKVNEHLKEE